MFFHSWGDKKGNNKLFRPRDVTLPEPVSGSVKEGKHKGG